MFQSYSARQFGRRRWLRLGGLGLGALGLGRLVSQANEDHAQTAPSRSRVRSVIMVYLPGGPSHIDMYDMKPDAPVEFRGEFKPISTNVPGLDVCELMPRHAEIADKLTVVRGLRTFGNGHDPYEILTSDPREASKLPPDPRPVFGSVIGKLKHVAQRGRATAVPPYVGIKPLHMLSPSTNDDPETAAYLGDAFRPFRATGPGLADLTRPIDVSLDRLADRQSLLRGFDGWRRDLDRLADEQGDDPYTAQALELARSSKIREAFDLDREPETTKASYGESTDLLLALRLVEAGVSVVTVPLRYPVILGDFAHGKLDHWDTHWHHFPYLRAMLPRYDQALAAMISDLYRRGLDEETLVVVWGEFGRTPLVDYTLVPGVAGRGHWPEAGFVLFSGGGLRMGRVIGETDRRGERAKGKPHTPANVLSTIYRLLGIDPSQTFVDLAGRPRYILDEREPIRELL